LQKQEMKRASMLRGGISSNLGNGGGEAARTSSCTADTLVAKARRALRAKAVTEGRDVGEAVTYCDVPLGLRMAPSRQT
jgi:hypothetical protein